MGGGAPVHSMKSSRNADVLGLSAIALTAAETHPPKLRKGTSVGGATSRKCLVTTSRTFANWFSFDVFVTTTTETDAASNFLRAMRPYATRFSSLRVEPGDRA